MLITHLALQTPFPSQYITDEEQTTYALPKVRDAVRDMPVLLDYLDLLEEMAADKPWSIWDVMSVGGPNYPSFTEELLDKTCESFTNMLVIDATVLQVAFSYYAEFAELTKSKMPIFGNFVTPSGTTLDKSHGCNHAVYLEKCDKERNEYTIWTWGTTVVLTKEMLLGWPTSQPDAPPTPGMYTWNTGALCASITADQITMH